MTDSRSQNGLSGIEERLRVRDIATFGLLSCLSTDDPNDVFRREDLRTFDQVPIIEGGRVLGIRERVTPSRTRSLDDSVLVSADAPLSQFVHTVQEQPYRLVVEGMAITGIVTWSDLLKLPVTVLAFTVVARLELAMNQRIADVYGKTDSWLDELHPKQRAKVEDWAKQRANENLVLPLVEAASLTHKAIALRGALSDGRSFEADLKKIITLRDNAAHVQEAVHSAADLAAFVGRIETAEAWPHLLELTDGPQNTTESSWYGKLEK